MRKLIEKTNAQDSMFRGWGYIWLAGSAGSVITGVIVIQKMVKVDV